MTPDDAPPPRVGMGQLKRALIAGLVITLCSAAAVSAAVLLELESLSTELGIGEEIPEVTDAEAGDPRTILLIGSDERYIDKKLGLPVRSDTLILARVNPEKDVITMLSLPRDLKVRIPGLRYSTDRINAAYANGGARKTVQTVKKLFEQATGETLEINHVLQVQFGGFRRAVKYVGGVYIDVDRRYFNDNNPPVDSSFKYATIDVEPGYQNLTGHNALDYVRYRHGDNDLVRSARQQDFLQQLKAAPGIRALMNLNERRTVIRLFRRYIEVDKSVSSAKDIISLLKLAINVRNNEVREVRLEVGDAGVYVTASDAALKRAFEALMDPKPVTRKVPKATAPTKKKKKRGRGGAPVANLEDARRAGEDLAIIEARKLSIPFYFPTKRLRGSSYAGHPSRVYTVKDPEGKRYQAYRLVLYKGQSEYYGVQGLQWKDPPILDAPHDVQRVGGKRLKLYWSGRRLRLVAWEADEAVYWVSNTLNRALGNREMLGIASSLSRLKTK